MKAMIRVMPWMIVLAMSLAGCGNGGPANSTAADGPSDAQVIYKQNCLSCHGGDLEGKMGPNLQAVGEKYELNELQAIIMNGQGRMPAFKKRLDEQEITVLAEWLAAYSK